jgi:hypothetical protein
MTIDPPPIPPAALPVLYAMSIGLQAYVGYSTFSATNSGDLELNPFMKQIAGNPAPLITMKAGMTRRRSRRRNGCAAVATEVRRSR